jgi:hypothetical protein
MTVTVCQVFTAFNAQCCVGMTPPVPGRWKVEGGDESDETITDCCTFRDLPSDKLDLPSDKSGKRAPRAQQDGPTIKHSAVSPQAMRGYSELYYMQ